MLVSNPAGSAKNLSHTLLALNNAKTTCPKSTEFFFKSPKKSKLLSASGVGTRPDSGAYVMRALEHIRRGIFEFVKTQS